MDFATRDRYRHVVGEDSAKKSRLSESEVARKAIQLAREARPGKAVMIERAHVGSTLLTRGLSQLERTAEVQRSASGTFGE